MVKNGENMVKNGKKSWDTALLDILICPVSGGRLDYDSRGGEQRLISQKAGLAFPVRDGIAVLLKDEAQEI